MTASLKILILKRDILKQEAEKSTDKWATYKERRNQVTKEMRSTVKKYYYGLINESKGNPKKMWKTINKVLGRNQHATKPSNVEVNGIQITREQNVLEALKQHFISVGPNMAKADISMTASRKSHNHK